ncbi:lactonase family protein [Paenibacillus sp. sgz302251]|uniref:lactonase family protein n=1 Tax=Paenibacillus sp. sgz302251 TaxID=3414493 RepID=UPI003C7CEA21
MSNESSRLPAYSGVLYIGSYGSAEEATIHTCTFNGVTNQLEIIQTMTGVENASYLAVHPNGKQLFAASETEQSGDADGGAIAVYEIDALSGLLRTTGNRSLTHGAHPCYISMDSTGKALFAANYSGGNVALLPITEAGELEAAASIQQHEGELGPNASRQDAPHAHCITPWGDTGYVCAVDLGIDAIVIYRYDDQLLTLTPHSVCKVHPGAGPRHLVFHPSLPFGYVMNELDSTITILKADVERGTLAVVKAVSALPAEFVGYNDAADIHLAPSGRYLYSSNRGHNSMAVFEVDQSSGELTLIQHIDCGGESPRNFAIAPGGRHLLVAHQKSGTVVVFNVDIQSGLLSPTSTVLPLKSPVCIMFGRGNNVRIRLKGIEQE